MKLRPEFLLYLSIGYALMAAFVVICMILPLSLRDSSTAPIQRAGLSHWALLILCLINIPISLQASRILIASAPLSFSLAVYESTLLAGAQLSWASTHTLLSVLCLGLGSLMVLSLLTPKMWGFFADPKLRWWLQAPRHTVKFPVSIKTETGEVINCQTHNVSQTGMFLELSGAQAEQLDAGQKLTVSLDMAPHLKGNYETQIVRKAPSKGSYPSGVGVKFVVLNANDKQSLKNVLRMVSHNNGRSKTFH